MTINGDMKRVDVERFKFINRLTSKFYNCLLNTILLKMEIRKTEMKMDVDKDRTKFKKPLILNMPSGFKGQVLRFPVKDFPKGTDCIVIKLL